MLPCYVTSIYINKGGGEGVIGETAERFKTLYLFPEVGWSSRIVFEAWRRMGYTRITGINGFLNLTYIERKYALEQKNRKIDPIVGLEW